MKKVEEITDEQEKELYVAGWERTRTGVWKSASGLLYRNAARAWELMKTHPELNSKKL